MHVLGSQLKEETVDTDLLGIPVTHEFYIGWTWKSVLGQQMTGLKAEEKDKEMRVLTLDIVEKKRDHSEELLWYTPWQVFREREGQYYAEWSVCLRQKSSRENSQEWL